MRTDCTSELRESEAAGEPVADWWNRAHKSKQVRWLSDYPGEEVWKRLDVENLLVPEAAVLEIGVGTGRSAVALKGRGCKVSALDISSVALERVSSFAECYLPEQQLPSGAFDVAMSHLVAQHMTDADLLAQIRAVVASLKPMGVFAMQFSDHADGQEHLHDESSLCVKLGEVCRSPREMEKLASAAGVKVVKLLEREVWNDYGLRWYVVHLMKVKTIEVVSLIYKSIDYANFIVDQLSRYAVDFDDWKVNFRLVANDPTVALERHLKEIGVNHTVFRNQNPNEYYMNRVYKAWNAAGMTSNADYVCFVNSDMAFSPNWLKNLVKHIAPDRVLTSRLVEAGKMPSGLYGISKYFGNTPQSYSEQAFLGFTAQVSEDEIQPNGLYMPLLISRELFSGSNGYPLGNVYADGVGTCNGPVIKSGDVYYFEDNLRTNFGVSHFTVFDSVVYHFQEGELDEGRSKPDKTSR
jgi:hypothetical protein